MKSFTYSPRTDRFTRQSISVLSPRTNITLSPSKPITGHVSSIKSTWENRTKLSDRILSPRISTGRKSFSGGQENDEAYDNNIRPSWNRTETVKTTNTGRKSFSRTTYEEENVGDTNNKAKSHHNPRTATKKIKDNAWVRKTDTDDTTSLSSNEVSIQKSSSNISDVSAPSVASSSHWRYRANNGQQSRHADNKFESYDGIESYTSITTGSSRVNVLASKLATESLGIKGVSSSGDDSSTLNYSLEKLPEDDEEDMYSRQSLGGRESVGNEESAKPSLTANRNSIEAKFSRDRASLDQVDLSQKSDASSTGMDDSLRAYVELSSRLNQKLSSVPSTDSSLVYSMGNTDEPSQKYNNNSTYSYDQDDPDPSDLVASTLAECRLLLGMSPPPTPTPVAEKTAQVKMTMPPRSPAIRMAAAPPTALSPANSTASMGLGLDQFLQCPCCHNEFTNDTSSETNKNRQPLHSFACDHIVCYECVFLADGDAMVTCPECGEARAFDKTRPVVSRSYCMLVRSIEIMNSGTKGAQRVRRLSRNDEDYGRGESGSKGRDSPVPLQIELFLPTRNEVSLVHESPKEGMGSKTDERNQINEPEPEDVSTFTAPYPDEPDTPVSRAEFRFLQRKEKLAQSLEKVNRLLERSKMNKDGVSMKKIGDDVPERVEDSEELLEGGALNPMSLNNIHVEEAEESVCEEEPEVMPDEERDSADEEIGDVALNSAGNSDNVVTRGFQKPTIDTLYTDEGLDWTLPRQEQIARKKVKPELRVDTGNYTPLPCRTNPYLDLKDEPTASYESPSKLTEVSGEDKTGTPVTEIFRTSPMSPPAVFGTLGNSSHDSSLTDNDSRCLLGGNASTTSGLSSFKEKRYGLHKSPLKDSKAVLAEKQRSAEEPRCPQFLPSLAYSTMQESDEMVGLVREKERRAAVSRKLHYNTPNKLFAKQWKNARGTRLSFGKIESYDAGSLGGYYSAANRIGKMDSYASDEDDRGPLAGQTYDFVQHSCSFSPSTDSMSLRGALITHKPKFHKKVLSKLAFKGRKQYSRRR